MWLVSWLSLIYILYGLLTNNVKVTDDSVLELQL